MDINLPSDKVANEKANAVIDWVKENIYIRGLEHDATINNVDVRRKDINRVTDPEYYKGSNNIQVWDVITDRNLGFLLGNAVKYLSRAGKKDDELYDLNKALTYLHKYRNTLHRRTTHQRADTDEFLEAIGATGNKANAIKAILLTKRCLDESLDTLAYEALADALFNVKNEITSKKGDGANDVN